MISPHRTKGEIPMSEFIVTRSLDARQAGDGGAGRADRGSWQATVISSEGAEIALTGRYDQVSEPDRLVMTVPGDVVTAITLDSAPNDSTQIAYTFDVDESMHAMVTESVDGVLGRVSTVLAGIA